MIPKLLAVVTALGLVGTAASVRGEISARRSFADTIADIQPKIVKIYGAGGLQGLEPYQSGFLITPTGHILTVWSYVLDTDYIGVTLNDGRRYPAQLVGADPRLEIAVLKIDADDLDHFVLSDAATVETGARVLAFSNLFGVATGDEPASVLHGIVSAKTQLNARRGAFQSTYQGPVLVLDAMTNNPGAAGGALTDASGRLLGLLGKELRNSLTNTWLNYAVPVESLQSSVDDILAGRVPAPRGEPSSDRPSDPMTLAILGVVLVPDILPKTPPFIDQVLPGSPAEQAGLQPDDLILFVNERMATSCKSLRDELSYVDRIDPVRLTVQRDQELVEVELRVE